ncbi:hypothetical protein B0A50_08102 [Salinomyces thailandicus]|uniref:Luciferase domain-containing protein n=1 Tax=Salinomyces thailandicus TaxID=706561 RepID=A0A4U0TK39_9PEZI|nr:hypothetical protein B0A50_08102 [Salinomyces thailandica]
MLSPHEERPSSIASFYDLNSSQTARLALTFTALAILLPFLLYIYHDYLAFISLGPGGTPPTFLGFLRVELLSLFALRNPHIPGPTPERFKAHRGYLVDLPKREGPKPDTRGIAPHRQIPQRGSPQEYERLCSAIRVLAASDEKLVLGRSCFEKQSTGLFARSPAERTCEGEVCHVHPSDGSLHLTLHPADAEVVLGAGWGERHPIARGGWVFERFVPVGFVMCYAPRGERQVEVVLEVVRAAAWFVGGGDRVGKGWGERRDSGYVSLEDGERRNVASS